MLIGLNMEQEYQAIYGEMTKDKAKALREALDVAGYEAEIRRVSGSGFFYYMVYCIGLKEEY